MHTQCQIEALSFNSTEVYECATTIISWEGDISRGGG